MPAVESMSIVEPLIDFEERLRHFAPLAYKLLILKPGVLAKSGPFLSPIRARHQSSVINHARRRVGVVISSGEGNRAKQGEWCQDWPRLSWPSPSRRWAIAIR